MLRSVIIRDLAIIESAQFDLQSGLSVWSGETGAGKTLLVSAIGLIMGARADVTQVRTGRPEALVTGVFDLSRPDIREAAESLLEQPIVDDDLIITRRVNAESGRSSASVNGLPVSVRTLQKLGRVLVDYVGQHETRSLTETETQTRILDAFGNLDASVSQFNNARNAYEHARTERLRAIQELNSLRRERELLEFEISELEKLEPSAEEPARLMQEARTLARAEEIRRLCGDGFQRLYGREDAIQDQLAKIVKKLQPIASLSADVSQAVDGILSANSQIAESAYLLQGVVEQVEANPKRLEWIEDRLADYRRLASRFSVDENALELLLNSRRERLEHLRRTQETIADYAELQSLWADCIKRAAVVHKKRQSACQKMSVSLPKILKKLGLGTSRLCVEVAAQNWPESVEELPCSATDPAPVTMLFQPNEGEVAQPLEMIASGGELSRLLLAILVCLSDSDRIPTVIFDEIDTGVGGRLGADIGEVLRELSVNHQVICITHLPQLAAFADHHFLVHKSRTNKRTQTSIRKLADRNERVSELAAMLRGAKADEKTMIEARSMLEHSQIRS